MSGAISYFLDFIERSIPEKLLNAAFRPLPNSGELDIPYSLREIIRIEVIDKWLLRDINTLGEMEMTLPLSTADLRTTSFNQVIIRIPRSATAGRRIIGLSKLGFFNPYAYSGFDSIALMGTVEMQRAIAKLGTAAGAIPRVETGYVTLINENTFLVEDYIMTPNTGWVGVLLEADEQLSTIKPAYWGPLAEFSLLACKAVIHRIFLNDRDMSLMMGGQELGSLNDLVNSWSDTDEQYQDMRRTRLKKILAFNDKNAKLAHIKMLVS